MGSYQKKNSRLASRIRPRWLGREGPARTLGGSYAERLGRESMAARGLVANSINHVRYIIGDQQAAIWMNQHVSRPSPSFVIFQPTFDKGIGNEALVRWTDESDFISCMTGSRAAVPTSVFGDEQGLLEVLREAQALAKGNAKGCNVGTQREGR